MAGNAGKRGEPLGSGCLRGYFCVFRGRIGRAARQTEEKA